MDIRAHSSATFRVAFRPPLDGQYFSQTIEVVACFKAHRSFRGVAHSAVLPPWTMPVQVKHTDTHISIHMQAVQFSTLLLTLSCRQQSVHVQVGSAHLLSSTNSSSLYNRQKSMHIQLAAQTCAPVHIFFNRESSLHNRQKCICMQTGSMIPCIAAHFHLQVSVSLYQAEMHTHKKGSTVCIATHSTAPP